MADLELHGPLDLRGTLDLAGQGGKVLINRKEALVENVATDTGVPVPLPSPQSMIDSGTGVTCVRSLGTTIKAGGTALVTTGMVMQGTNKSWPGMVMPSTTNAGPTAVTANGLPVNVLGDKASIFPNGSVVVFNGSSGQ